MITNSTAYNTIHVQRIRHTKKTGVCQNCKQQRYTEWANVTGTYQADDEDWIEYCKPCHMKYDAEVLGVKFGRPKKIQNPS